MQKPRWIHEYVVAAVTSSSTTKLFYPAANKVFHSHLNSRFQTFMSTLDKQQDPDSFREAIQHKHWCNAVNTELQALERNGTWSLAAIPKEKRAIG